MTMKPANKGLDAVLMINGKAVGGQQGATLTRSMLPINITNQINGEWDNSIAGIKRWSLNCSGILIKDADSFAALEDAFNTGSPIEVKLKDGAREYQGMALITSFPLTTVFNSTCTYTLALMGCGELK